MAAGEQPESSAITVTPFDVSRRASSRSSQSTSMTSSHILLTKELFVDGWIRSAASSWHGKKARPLNRALNKISCSIRKKNCTLVPGSVVERFNVLQSTACVRIPSSMHKLKGLDCITRSLVSLKRSGLQTIELLKNLILLLFEKARHQARIELPKPKSRSSTRDSNLARSGPRKSLVYHLRQHRGLPVL